MSKSLIHKLFTPMDQIISFADEQIEISKNPQSENQTSSNDQELEDIVRYELNFPNVSLDFCDLVNHQLNKIQENINGKLESVCDLELEKISTNKNKLIKPDDMPDHIPEFVDMVQKTKESTLSLCELNLMIKCLSEYRDKFNSEFIDQEAKKIEREQALLKAQKSRALDFLYEVQDLCASLYGF